MSKNRAKESLKPQNRPSRVGTIKQFRPVTGKGIDRYVKTLSSREKAARTTNQSLSQAEVILTQTMAGTSMTSKPVRPIAVNPQLQELERGRRLKQLHDQGLSFAELARKFGCSKSLVRDLVELASLPKDLEESYIQGKLGRKKVLKMALARKKLVESKTAVLTPGPRNAARQNPLPALTEEERQKKVTENARLIIDWIHSIDLAPCYWEGFFEQVQLGLYGPFQWLFSAEAPQMHEIKTDDNPWDVIKRCKLQRENPRLVTDIINDLVTWLARWIQRIIPDRVMMEDAIDKARRRLLREAQKGVAFDSGYLVFSDHVKSVLQF